MGGAVFPSRSGRPLVALVTSCLPTAHLLAQNVGLGLHLEFHAGGKWIITSHVRAIAVEPSATGAPC